MAASLVWGWTPVTVTTRALNSGVWSRPSRPGHQDHDGRRAPAIHRSRRRPWRRRMATRRWRIRGSMAGALAGRRARRVTGPSRRRPALARRARAPSGNPTRRTSVPKHHPGGVGHHRPHVVDEPRARRRPSPPGSAWMKLACLADTSAVPSRKPFRPHASISRPAESPGGLVKTDPALLPPGWLARRHRTISSMVALPSARDRPGSSWWTAGHHHLGGAEVGVPVAEAEPLGRPASCTAAGPGPPSGSADQGGRRVRAVAAGVHPDGPPDRAGHPDRPLQAVQPGRGGAAGQHREAEGGPGPRPRSRRWPASRSRRPGRPPARRSPGRPPAGWSPARAPAPAPPSSVEGPGHAPTRSSSSAGSTKSDGGAPHPVGGEGAQGMVAAGPGPRARPSEARSSVRAVTVRSPARIGHELVGERGQVAGAQRAAQVTGLEESRHGPAAARAGRPRRAPACRGTTGGRRRPPAGPRPRAPGPRRPRRRR